MRDVIFGAWIFPVEIAPAGQQFGHRHFPREVIFFALVPPSHQRREILKLDRRGFRVIFPAFRQRLFVIPDFTRRPGAVKEQEVRRDAGVGRKNAIRQPDNGVQVEILEQFFLNAGAHAIAKQCAVRHDHGGARLAGPADAISA